MSTQFWRARGRMPRPGRALLAPERKTGLYVTNVETVRLVRDGRGLPAGGLDKEKEDSGAASKTPVSGRRPPEEWIFGSKRRLATTT